MDSTREDQSPPQNTPKWWKLNPQEVSLPGAFRKLAVFGLFLALLNVLCVWLVVFDARNQLKTPLPSNIEKLMEKEFAEKSQKVDPNRTAIVFLAMDISMMHYSVNNRYNHIIIADGMAFALACFGFSLFVMGLESSYTLEAGGKGGTAIKIAASSPGLLCFILAVVIIIAGLQKDLSYSVKAPHINEYNSEIATAKSNPQPPPETSEISHSQKPNKGEAK